MLLVTQLIGFGAFTEDAGTSYRYFRIATTAAGASGSVFGINEFHITTAGGDVPSSSMTGDSAPSPLVASSSNSYGAGFEAYRAFDNSDSNEALSSQTTGSGGAVSPTWNLTIDLGAGNGVVPTGFKLRSSGNSGRTAPVDFTFEGSNDGSSWTTLKTVTGQSWAYPETKTYTLP